MQVGGREMRANEQQTQAQEDFLETLRKGHTFVGIRLKGYIEAFDQYVLMLKSETVTQTIYKHAISTVQEDIGKPPSITSRDASGRQDGEGKRAPYTSHRKVRSMRPDDE
jgi:host factor-I protein